MSLQRNIPNALSALVSVDKERDLSVLRPSARDFPSADLVGKLTVFNIGGNKVRLIAALHYNRKKVYIRAVLTHAEYNTDTWKE